MSDEIDRADEPASADANGPAVRALHDLVDAQVRPLAELHRERLQCGLGCASCCVDDLSVFEVEAARIEAEHAELLATGRAHAPGACAFLGEAGECRIYESRPYVCRTQGLPLRWFSESADEEIVEHRSICELNEAGPPVIAIDEEECWLIGPVEHRLMRLQADVDGEGTRRISLRSLFRSAAKEPRRDGG